MTTSAVYECPVCAKPFVCATTLIKYGTKKACSKDCGKLVAPNPALAPNRVPVDYQRIIEYLKLAPDAHSNLALIDLWNSETDYELPRIDLRDKHLARLGYTPLNEPQIGYLKV